MAIEDISEYYVVRDRQNIELADLSKEELQEEVMKHTEWLTQIEDIALEAGTGQVSLQESIDMIKGIIDNFYDGVVL